MRGQQWGRKAGMDWKAVPGMPAALPEGCPPRGAAAEKSESVGKPGSVVDDHSSATGVTTCL